MKVLAYHELFLLSKLFHIFTLYNLEKIKNEKQHSFFITYGVYLFKHVEFFDSNKDFGIFEVVFDDGYYLRNFSLQIA